MKSFLDGKEGHKIFLNLNKLPKDTNLIKSACMRLDN